MVNGAAPLCRSCGQADLRPILSLGRTPLANALLTAEQLREPEATYPLDLVFCPDVRARPDHRDGTSGSALP